MGMMELVLWFVLDAARLNNLGAGAYARGDYATAESLYTAALAVAGPAGASKIESNLAALYKRQGRYNEAAVRYARVIAFRERLLGPSHPDVALAINNLAEARRIEGRLAEAQALFERALALSASAEVRGAVLNNLAEVHRTLGRYSSAERMLKEALAVKEELYGAHHPQVAITLNNLGKLLEDCGDPASAEGLYARAVQIWERTRPGEDLAIGLTNLGRVHGLLGRFAESERLHAQALSELGTREGPVAAATLHNLSLLRMAQGRLVEAEALLRRSLALRENPAALVDYARALRGIGKKRQARQAEERVRALTADSGGRWTVDVRAFR